MFKYYFIYIINLILINSLQIHSRLNLQTEIIHPPSYIYILCNVKVNYILIRLYRVDVKTSIVK